MQYLVNDRGRNTAVVVPIKEWNDLQKAKRKLEILNGIENALQEVSEIKNGKLHKITLKGFLNDLLNNNYSKF